MRRNSWDLQDMLAVVSLLGILLTAVLAVLSLYFPATLVRELVLVSGAFTLLSGAMVLILELLYSQKTRRSLHWIQH